MSHTSINYNTVSFDTIVTKIILLTCDQKIRKYLIFQTIFILTQIDIVHNPVKHNASNTRVHFYLTAQVIYKDGTSIV